MKAGCTEALLTLAAVLYCGAQWVGASRIGNSSFFAPHAQDRADLQAMSATLTRFLRERCVQGPREVLFDDRDAFTPALALPASVRSVCTPIRETPVTPFTEKQLDGCTALLVPEFVPGRKESPESALAIAPTSALSRGSRPWVEQARWLSPDARYGLAVYGHRCAGLPAPGKGGF
jgi:hypothetical protein